MLHLSAPDEFWDEDMRVLAHICNGIGGGGDGKEKAWLRNVLTEIYRGYQTSAAIHDTDYEYASRDKEIADREFLENMVKEWAYRWGWSRFIRPQCVWARYKIQLAYWAVVKFGNEFYGSSGSIGKEIGKP